MGLWYVCGRQSTRSSINLDTGSPDHRLPTPGWLALELAGILLSLTSISQK